MYVKYFVYLLMLFLLSCSSIKVGDAEKHIIDDNWLDAVLHYRMMFEKNPNDVGVKSKLRQTELKAADYYYKKGMLYLSENRDPEAIEQFQFGLSAFPNHAKLTKVLNEVLAKEKALLLFQEAQLLERSGNLNESLKTYKRVLYADSEHNASKAAIKRLNTAIQKKQRSTIFDSKELISLNFNNTDIRTAFEFIAKSFDINVVFDDSVKNTQITLFAKDMTFIQALELMLTTTNTFYQRVGSKTLLIAQDTSDKRGQYEEYIIKTYHLNSISANDMVKVLKGIVPLDKVVINESMNSFHLREKKNVINIVNRLVSLNDTKSAEVLMEVEILEVNRTKAERLGVDYGSYKALIRIPDPIPLGGSIGDAIRDTATLTLPSVSINFFKQNVDAKTLANPKIRVLSGKKASIHIGDKIPLQSSTVTESTGQIRTLYEYKDIGIKLVVEPIVNYDNSTKIKLSLEVSVLGENLGTLDNPAYRIGTRKAETIMLLRDGETAILGGLIKDEITNTQNKLPGLGEVTLFNKLFASSEGSSKQTDILLTIAPRILRSWNVSKGNLQQFHSGTKKKYATLIFDEVENNSFKKPVKKLSKKNSLNKNNINLIPKSMKSLKVNEVASGGGKLISRNTHLNFSKTQYDKNNDQPFNINLELNNAKEYGVDNIKFELMYNPDIVSFVDSDNKNIEIVQQKGKLSIRSVDIHQSLKTNHELFASLTFKGNKQGDSFLVLKTQEAYSLSGQKITIESNVSEIKIK